MKPKSGAGFTLIELLAVISIIGLITAVVLVSLSTARAKARDTKRVADLRQMVTALDLYYDKNGAYPIETCSPDWAAEMPGYQACWDDLGAKLVSFMPKLPRDPIWVNGVDRTYWYEANSAGQHFILLMTPETSAVLSQGQGLSCYNNAQYYCKSH